MQCDSISTHIEKMTDDCSRNDSWQSFNPDEIAEASLQLAVEKANIPGPDGQISHFQEFLTIPTDLSSLEFADKVQQILHLVAAMTQLMKNMIKEVQKYSDMGNDLRELIQYSIETVMQAKHNVNMTLPSLRAAKTQFEVIQNVMSTDLTAALNQIKKDDLKLVLNRMAKGITSILDLSKSSKIENRNLEERI